MERFANNADSTLNGAINDSITTIIVVDGSPFPSIGDFRLLLGSDADTGEIVLATARSSNTITVVRGQEGTTAQSWTDGTTVTHILTAGATESLRDTLKGKTLNSTLETISISEDGYALTWINTDGYWAARPVSIGDGYQHLNILDGLYSNIGTGSNTFTRIGSVRIDSTVYGASPIVIFEGIFEATSGQTAELRLYNVTDGSPVSGSTLTTSSTSSDYQFAGITLASGAKIYEAQIRITNGSPGSGDGVICSNAKIRIRG